MDGIKYAKGHQPKDLEAACGGEVLARNRNFMKDQDDDMHPMGTGLLGPLNEQNYAKKGGKKDKLADREGDTKSTKPVMPRK